MGLQSVACIEWTDVFSVDISLMQEKGRGKEGGQEHLVSFFCLLFHLFQLSNIPLSEKKRQRQSREQERDGRKGQS